MHRGVGLTVTLRQRLAAADAHTAGDVVDGARILRMFGDVAAELAIRLDGDEGRMRTFEAVEFSSPVHVGDYVEATGVVTNVGATTRTIAFEARKVVQPLRRSDAAPTAADALAEPLVVSRAVGTLVVPEELQRRPRLVLPALSGPPPEHAHLPEPRPIITPPPRVIVTPPSSELVVTAAIEVGDRPADVASEAARCRDAGASVVQLWSRAARSHAAWLAVVEAVRASSDVLVEVTTRPPLLHADAAPAARSEVAALPVDLEAIVCGSCNVGDRLLSSPRARVQALLSRARASRRGVVLECFDAGHVAQARALLVDGLWAERSHFRFVLGWTGGLAGDEDELRFLAGRLPGGASWSVAAKGDAPAAVIELALRLGGHVYVGSDETDFALGAPRAVTSADEVTAVARAAQRAGRLPVDPARARELFGLTPTEGVIRS